MMNIKRAAVLGIALSTLFCVPAFAKTEGQWVNDGRQFQKPDGTLAYNEWIEGDNGSFFYVGADGKMATGWLTLSGKTYWLNTEKKDKLPLGACLITDESGALT